LFYEEQFGAGWRVWVRQAFLLEGLRVSELRLHVFMWVCVMEASRFGICRGICQKLIRSESSICLWQQATSEKQIPFGNNRQEKQEQKQEKQRRFVLRTNMAHISKVRCGHPWICRWNVTPEEF
jgi:hypothetical protein